MLKTRSIALSLTVAAFAVLGAGCQNGTVPGNDGERAVRSGHGEQLGFHGVAFWS